MMPVTDDEDSAREFADLGVDRFVPLIATDDLGAPAQRLKHLERLAAICS